MGGTAAASAAAAADGMSSTARLILDTLEKMSTPLRDAQKMIPARTLPILETPSRAERRKAVFEKLNVSQSLLLGARSPDGTPNSLKTRRRDLAQVIFFDSCREISKL